ncbi:COP9 signalosome complex subunit 6 [Hyphodiscus hymeniophilus]|uniref:COP9 signalosome complex subunit 6 n=1 Tax=Hyphodiscus hymeniophilus TaxID=353542 RepID=A0A9P6VF55_9HELO|nr:COP9 signalosome complex subunit 6 [Hyphodiscus hymeniophilus]
MAVETPNPLLSTQKSSDGLQNGREITIEHAFECLLLTVNDEVVLNDAWFEDRLQQMKDVHKVPALDLVGWYTILPLSGPQPVHLPIHRQILDSYNESAILLGFHPQSVLEGSVGGKLPLTIYESNYEADETAESGEDKEMKDEEAQLGLKFKELPYSVETGEAEMISVDFVARGGGNATAVDSTQAKVKPAEDVKGKGKSRAENVKAEDDPKKDFLSREDEESIASLTAKANAIKMLHARINLIAVYLQKLPPSYLDDSNPEGVETNPKKYTPVNHAVLRSIQALLSRLSLLIPADSTAFQQELMSEQNDVNLVSLLGTMTQSIRDAREMGKKFSVVESGKHIKSSLNRSMDGGAGFNMGGVGDIMD